MKPNTTPNPIDEAINAAAIGATCLLDNTWANDDSRWHGVSKFAEKMKDAAEYCHAREHFKAEDAFTEAERIVTGNDDMTDDALVAIQECGGNEETTAEERANLAAMFCVSSAGLIANYFEDAHNKERE
ncbi:MAG: hypothetical protein ACR2PR_08960 [Pseudohongiellaceae bacterium]